MNTPEVKILVSEICNIPSLEEQINKYINDGWKLYGELKSTTLGNCRNPNGNDAEYYTIYTQVVVKNY